MVEFDRSAFISKFQDEAQDLLQRLNEGVIALEEDSQNAELIDEMPDEIDRTCKHSEIRGVARLL